MKAKKNIQVLGLLNLRVIMLFYVFAIPTIHAQVLQQKVVEYDVYGNPTEVEDAKGIKTAYDWSEDGMSLIGIFSNSEANDIFAHSFAYDGMEGWTFVDRYSDSDTEVSVVDGKLKLKNFYAAQNGEFDRIYYDHGSEITQDLVWEFDVKIANSNNWDLQMNAGGSGWNTYSVNSETAIWTAINNESWRVYNGSSWILLKSGLNVGKTYNFRIIMHPGSNTADYYLNGEKVGSAISFRQNSSGIQKIAFGNYGYGSVTTEWYIDNVRMYPETAQAQSQEVNKLFGSPVAIKDVSGSTNRFEYDDFGRLYKTYNANGELTTTNQYYYSLDGNSSYNPLDPNRVETWIHYDPNNSSNTTKSVSYLDGLGRKIQTQQRGGGNTFITATHYNDRGLPEAVSRPFKIYGQTGYLANPFGASFSGGEQPGESTELDNEYDGKSGGSEYPYSYTQYEASPLARITESRMPGGSNYATTNTYGINDVEEFVVFGKTWSTGTLQKTVTRDPDGKETITYTDGWGQTIISGVNMNPNSDDILDKSSSDLVTYFEYDLLGNLVRVLDPRGLVTSYDYNELGQLELKELPDQNGVNRYTYDKAGNLRFVQTPNHVNNGSYSSLHNQIWTTEKTISLNMPGQGIVGWGLTRLSGSTTLNFYIKDPINNTIESISVESSGSQYGQKVVRPEGYKFISDHINNTGYYMLGVSIYYKPFIYTYYNYDSLNRVVETGEVYSGSFSNADPDGNISSSKYPTIKYFYDDENKHPAAQNVNGRIARVEYRNLDSSDDWGKTWYSYNELGLIEWVRHQLPDQSSSLDKKIQYTYDELGRIKRMLFDSSQDPLNTNDDHYFWYEYDELGRVAQITSNRFNDQQSAYLEAQYSYFADGQVRELNLGEQAQSVDYNYTVQGWLSAINNPDGFSEYTGNYVNDRFGMFLRYNSGFTGGVTPTGLYNGNIAQIEWEQEGMGTNHEPFYSFSYDNANRLTNADFHDPSTSVDNNGGLDATYYYDKNGNNKGISRRDEQGDYYYNFNYHITSFVEASNKISSLVYKLGSSGNNIGAFFDYDANGNMKKNDMQEIITSTYDWRNLPTNITTPTGTVEYAYDADGNRIKKQVSGGNPTWYIRGADGEVIAVYSGNNLLYINIPGGIGRINK